MTPDDAAGDSEGKRAFVTGATGSIGARLCERLTADGWTVVALARPGSDAGHLAGLPSLAVVEGDLFDASLLASHMRGCAVVFHLAALVHAPRGSESAFHRINVEGTIAVRDAAISAGVGALIFFSTVAVYPETGELFDESSPTAPSTPYGTSKLAAESAVLQKSHAIRVTVLRLPVVYGPRDRGNIKRLISAIARGRFALPGTGSAVKTMVAVDNVADAAISVATDPRAAGGIFIVTDDGAPTLTEVVELISRHLGRPLPPTIPRALVRLSERVLDLFAFLSVGRLKISGDDLRRLNTVTRFSGERIRKELSIVPRVSLEEGMAEAVADFRRAGSKWKDETRTPA